ncbi:MAG: hypothetical protein ACJAYU_004287 [Bradymonadia bacterium]|jgi:hypothetical protein
MQKISVLHLIYALLAMVLFVYVLFIRASIIHADAIEPSYETEAR